MELPVAYLTERTTFERAIAENLFDDKAFGHANDDWLRLVAKRVDGDELVVLRASGLDLDPALGGRVGPRRANCLDRRHGGGLRVGRVVFVHVADDRSLMFYCRQATRCDRCGLDRRGPGRATMAGPATAFLTALRLAHHHDRTSSSER